MSGRSTLMAQVAELTVEVQHMNERVRALGRVAPWLQDAASERFSALIARRDEDLGSLRQRVGAGADLLECWREFRECKRRCVTLARELLAFSEGAFSRHAGLDLGLLPIAEALLTDLSRRLQLGWDPLIVLAEAEFYGEEAQIIRLRFPDVSVWNLTVAAHEFGHFAGPRLSAREEDGRYWGLTSPFRDILARERKRGIREWSRMHELFADMFAVFTTGPAYACSCLFLRFDPGADDEDGPTHPSTPKRVAMLLRTLERMDEGHGELPGVLDALRSRWRASVAAAKQLDAVSVQRAEPQVMKPLEATFEELWEVLQFTIKPRRYGTLQAAQRLKSKLLPDAGNLKLDKGITLTDVLNAAWLCRIDHWDDDRDVVPAISARAFELCGAIAHRLSVEE
jgi:hypothetical protein